MTLQSAYRWALIVLAAIAVLLQFRFMHVLPTWACAIIATTTAVQAYVVGLAMLRKFSTTRAVANLVFATVCVIFIFAGLYGSLGLNPAEAAQGLQSRVYFSTVTFTTLGYGDIQPSEPGRLFAAFEAFFGYCYLGFIIGFVTSRRDEADDYSENSTDTSEDR